MSAGEAWMLAFFADPLSPVGRVGALVKAYRAAVDRQDTANARVYAEECEAFVQERVTDLTDLAVCYRICQCVPFKTSVLTRDIR